MENSTSTSSRQSSCFDRLPVFSRMCFKIQRWAHSIIGIVFYLYYIASHRNTFLCLPRKTLCRTAHGRPFWKWVSLRLLSHRPGANGLFAEFHYYRASGTGEGARWKQWGQSDSGHSRVPSWCPHPWLSPGPFCGWTSSPPPPQIHSHFGMAMGLPILFCYFSFFSSSICKASLLNSSRLNEHLNFLCQLTTPECPTWNSNTLVKSQAQGIREQAVAAHYLSAVPPTWLTRVGHS